MRTFRLLYEIEFLTPLNDMIQAFIETVKKISNYIIMIIFYVITLSLIANEIFAFTVRFKQGTKIPDKEPSKGFSPIVRKFLTKKIKNKIIN